MNLQTTLTKFKNDNRIPICSALANLSANTQNRQIDSIRYYRNQIIFVVAAILTHPEAEFPHGGGQWRNCAESQTFTSKHYSAVKAPQHSRGCSPWLPLLRRWKKGAHARAPSTQVRAGHRRVGADGYHRCFLDPGGAGAAGGRAGAL